MATARTSWHSPIPTSGRRRPGGRAAWAWWALTVAAATATAADLTQHYRLPGQVALLLGAGQGLAVLLCFSRPVRALAMATALSALTAVVAVPVSPAEPWPWPVSATMTQGLVLATIGAVAVLDRRRRGQVLAAAWALSQLPGIVGLLLVPNRGYPRGLLGAALILAVAAIIGELLGGRRDLAGRLRDQLQVTDAERARRAQLQERARIARELHDVVAHHLSVVVVRADSAAHRLGPMPDDAREEFAVIADEARSSLEEMRRVLRLLRDEPTTASPPPRLADLEDLLDAARSAGAVIDLELTRPAAGGQLPAAAELVAYRVVQEAITNAIRHAPGAPIAVTVGVARDALQVSVVNGLAPRAAPAAPPAGGAGLGLAGITERVNHLDGTVSTGPTPQGGFRVQVAVPIEPERAPG